MIQQTFLSPVGMGLKNNGILGWTQTLGLAMMAAVTGLLKGVGGRLEQLEEIDSVSPVI